MRLVVVCLFAIVLGWGPRSLCAEESVDAKKIVVVIPSYNNRDWCLQNLGSVLAQKYHNYRVIYIDDASPDGTGDLVEFYLKEKRATDRVTLIKNSQRVGALANLYKAISSCVPDEIVVTLDGDDWFAHERVLERVAQAYQDPEVWVTYGQFVWYPSGYPGFASEVPRDVLEKGTIRHYAWVTTHLRTFYASLFQQIKLEDLLYNGSFFSMAWDLAFMWPMIEMAGVHSCFIPDVLYVYNNATSLNDHKVNPGLQIFLTHVIRDRIPYKAIQSIFPLTRRC